MITSSRLTPAPNLSARAHKPPMDRAASSRMITAPPGPMRSSAWTGPSRRPSAVAARAAVDSISVRIAGGWRDGVT